MQKIVLCWCQHRPLRLIWILVFPFCGARAPAAALRAEHAASLARPRALLDLVHELERGLHQSDAATVRLAPSPSSPDFVPGLPHVILSRVETDRLFFAPRLSRVLARPRRPRRKVTPPASTRWTWRGRRRCRCVTSLVMLEGRQANPLYLESHPL